MSLRQRLLLIIASVMILLAFALALLLMKQIADDKTNAELLRLSAAGQLTERMADQCFTPGGLDLERFYRLSAVALTADSALERMAMLDLTSRELFEPDPDTGQGHVTRVPAEIELPPFGDIPGETAMKSLDYTFAIPPRLQLPGGRRLVLLAKLRPPRQVDVESALFWVLMSVFAGAVVLSLLIYLAIWHLVLRPVEQLAREVDRLADEERALQAKATAAAAAPNHAPPQPDTPPGPAISNSRLELDRLQNELVRNRTLPPATGNEIQRLAAAFAGMERELREHRADLHAQIEKVVAERAQAQARWIAAERLNATGRLAAGVAHEVNNPLGGIRNALRTIRTREQARPAPDPRTLEYLDLMEDGLTRIGNIVTDLLGFSRRNNKPEPVDVVEVATAAQRLLAHRFRDANTAFDLANRTGGPVLITAERAQLSQVFHNLLTNALDAILERNTSPETRRVQMVVDKVERAIHIEVQDTGAGMSLETQSQATELFFTTKDPGKGTGLGLAVVATIIGDLGGQLNFRSSPAGTTVIITLPLENRSAQVHPESSSPAR